jgi:hypothetical protein
VKFINPALIHGTPVESQRLVIWRVVIYHSLPTEAAYGRAWRKNARPYSLVYLAYCWLEGYQMQKSRCYRLRGVTELLAGIGDELLDRGTGEGLLQAFC